MTVVEIRRNSKMKELGLTLDFFLQKVTEMIQMDRTRSIYLLESGIGYNLYQKKLFTDVELYNAIKDYLLCEIKDIEEYYEITPGFENGESPYISFKKIK